MPRLRLLREFIASMATVIETAEDEAAMLSASVPLLTALVSDDKWLPDEYSQPSNGAYSSYLLHCDSASRFSVVAFAWAPGQSTPIHDHGTWGVVGVLRGSELVKNYIFDKQGQPVEHGSERTIEAGHVDQPFGIWNDVHQVRNPSLTTAALSIHVYGANLAEVERHAYELNGQRHSFPTLYANTLLPNVWSER